MKTLFLIIILLTGISIVNAQRRKGIKGKVKPTVYDATYYENLSARQLKKSKIFLPVSAGLAAAGTGFAIAYGQRQKNAGNGELAGLDGIGFLFGSIMSFGGAIGTFIPGIHLRRKSKENHERATQLSTEIGFWSSDIPVHNISQPTVGIKLIFKSIYLRIPCFL